MTMQIWFITLSKLYKIFNSFSTFWVMFQIADDLDLVAKIEDLIQEPNLHIILPHQ